MSQTEIDKKYLNTDQAAKYLSVSEYTIRKYANSGLIPYYRPGGKGMLFDRSDLDAFVLKSKGQ